jgi:hypothetical protein
LGSMSRDVHSRILIGWEPATPPFPRIGLVSEGAIGQQR